MKETLIRRDARIIDTRHPSITGTALMDPDPITKLVPVRWDDGRRSFVFEGVLAPADGIRRKGMKESVA